MPSSRDSGTELADIAPSIAEQLEIDAKYAVYLDRQAADVAAYRRDESLELSETLDYDQMPGLSTEMRQKLRAIRPQTIGPGGAHRWRHAGSPYPPRRTHPARPETREHA